MTSRLRQFEHIVTAELPALFDEFGLAGNARGAITRYAEGLQDWMAGVLEWHRITRRYDESELRRSVTARRPFDLPAGVGTSAVGPLRAARR